MPVPALDGLPYIPSVIGYTHGRAMIGAPARAHFFVSPAEVLFGPARHLGGGPVQLGEEEHAPEELVASLLEQAVAAGEVAARGSIDGVALSRAAWASPEARRALAAAAHRAGMNLVRTEVSTTLAAIAHHTEREMTGLVVFVDVGGWKIEATVLAIEQKQIRALGRSVDATIGANWIDGRLVKALVHEVAPDDERRLLKDRLCHAMLREQVEAMRVQLSTENSASIALPFLTPMLGGAEQPIWRLERKFLNLLAEPLVEAVRVVCEEALTHAEVQAGDVKEVHVLGGLAHMPAVRDAVATFFGQPVPSRGDLDGLAARGAALVAEASLWPSRLRIVDDLDDCGQSVAASGWGQPIPPALTPAPEVLVSPPSTPSTEVIVGRPSSPASEHPGATKPAHLPLPSAHDQPVAAKPIHLPHPSAHDQPVAPKPAPPPVHVPRASQAAAATPPPPTAPAAPHLPAATVQSIPPTPSARGPEQALPSEGAIKNPREPAGLAAVPLDGPLPLTPPLSLAVLLLAIGRRRSFTGQLRLKRDSHEASIAIVRGGAAGSSLEMEQLRRSFEWPDGQYKISGEAPSARLVAMRQPMVGVVMHGIRSCLRVMDIRQVLDVLEPRLQEAPRVLESRAALVPMLGLSPRELRFVEHVLDGTTSADEILRRGGIGRETAVHLMFILQLFRALEWHSVEERTAETAAERLRQRARKLEKADHFEALGVHWSVSRAELERALRHIEEELKPGGRASQIEPRAAAQIVERARAAFQAVANEGDRNAYLLAIHPDLDFEAIESVAEDQNQWYAFRGAEKATQETARLKNELLELSRLQRHETPKPGR